MFQPKILKMIWFQITFEMHYGGLSQHVIVILNCGDQLLTKIGICTNPEVQDKTFDRFLKRSLMDKIYHAHLNENVDESIP